MSKTPKTPSVPAPQFVIFDPPIPGFEARSEIRQVKIGEHYAEGKTPRECTDEMLDDYIVLTPVKRIEDLLPVCKVECWAAQEDTGEWALGKQKPDPRKDGWYSDTVAKIIGDYYFNPFGLPVAPNPQWRETFYKFTPGQGWRKCEAGK